MFSCYPYRRRHLHFVSVTILLTFCLGCGGKKSSNPGDAKPKSPKKTPTVTDGIAFQASDGTTVYSLRKKGTINVLHGADDEVVAQIETKDAITLVADADGNVLAAITKNQTAFAVQDATRSVVFFRFASSTGANGWELQDREGKANLIIAKKGDGFEILNAQRQLHATVEAKDGVLHLNDKDGKAIYRTSGRIAPLAAACVACDSLKDIRLRMGLMIAVNGK